ncbi:hypothetical protein SEA_SWISSCHEESE_84 [Mycobacterium phage SwissCheese]|uniref:Uncharacterized protein n=3 Tax=Fromanvirus TaxID=186764 RepID=G1D3D2_9CAUD|nr:hypothetical protein CM08_gp82 [Mycobacterium phage Bruns]YP_009016776.1 hypothetical protein CL80_gp81 [Mycobacterium phage Euphoria]YP_009636808.1 hypothetical protein FGG24_gp83 [Mycobacterium phage JC27]AVJ49731.1 hypothetical protein SEA_FORSYTHEAST_83 [Mycobacterium phage Forsytheast]AXH45251.1 hypothetical protein SEA_SWISSCHEESE_84 [Mycobacterium phage SwissCheese]AXH46216.1 hypothetical protein SEA_MOOSE_83 [Mycobacterium phage Moose]AEJ93712.1 hypothetical protein EUPHORIA_81 [My
MNETELKAFNQIIAASYSPAELRKLYRRSNPGLPMSIEMVLSVGAIVAGAALMFLITKAVGL